MSTDTKKTEAFAQDLFDLLKKHYDAGNGITFNQAAGILVWNAYAALDQIPDRTRHERLAFNECGRAVSRICETVPGFIELQPPTCVCGAVMYRDGELWQCGVEHCRSYTPVHD